MNRAALPEEAWLAALAGLPEITPGQQVRLRARYGPQGAWEQVERGVVADGVLGAVRSDPRSKWSAHARRTDVAATWRAHQRAEVAVVDATSGWCAEVFAHDPRPPAVLFTRGDPAVLARPRVAVVGTRSCTRYGRDLALEWSRGLGEAGVSVVSGLARGIDAAAHQGVLTVAGAPPIGVVGCGLDVAYPRSNEPLWEQVAEQGLLLGEHPLGVAPRAWHFPQRNRLIAALAHVVVVVESHRRGGALITAREAFDRHRAVFAVPGPVNSPASGGTNGLVADGALVATSVDDLLLALGLVAAGRPTTAADPPTMSAVLSSPAEEVLRALGWQPATLEQVVVRTGLDIAAVAAALAELDDVGLVASAGGWFEQTTVRSGHRGGP